MNDPICNERGIPQSDCPPFCPHDFGPVGPDGFTRLAGYVAEYVNDSPTALRVKVAEHQWTALEMARKADAAERRAEEAEYHVEQLRDARDRAERRIEQVEALADEWREDYPSDFAACSRTADQWWRDLHAALDVEGVGTGAGEGATGQDTGTAWVTRSADCPEAPAQAHPLAPATEVPCPTCGGSMRFCECMDDPFAAVPCGPGCEPDRCDHEDCHHRHQWLDRPESDTRECLICGTEVSG